jgi:DNA-binding transcriptional ArsR family regulator
MGAIPSPEGIDKLIHERARLGIMSSLAAAGPMTFSGLKETLGMTDGNLSVHARVLEEAGYIRIEKQFVGRKPQTTMSLTAKGSKAFKDYVAYLESIVAPKKKGPG